jgi:hypothetical protein
MNLPILRVGGRSVLTGSGPPSGATATRTMRQDCYEDSGPERSYSSWERVNVRAQ